MNTRFSERVLDELEEKEYREAFVEEFISVNLPFQIRELREQRGWTQAELAKRAKMKQSAVSRMENPDSGKPNLQTLLRLAAAFDVALSIRFDSYTNLLTRMEDLSPNALRVPSFDEDQGLRQAAQVFSTQETSSAKHVMGTGESILGGNIEITALDTTSGAFSRRWSRVRPLVNVGATT
jgi:transcriptional regulator with XRE-family HTH domain